MLTLTGEVTGLTQVTENKTSSGDSIKKKKNTASEKKNRKISSFFLHPAIQPLHRKEEAAQEATAAASGGLGLPDETKATHSYTVLTHAGSRLQKQQRPRTMHAGPGPRLENSPTKMGRQRAKVDQSEPKAGGQKGVGVGMAPIEGKFSLKNKQNASIRGTNSRFFFRAFTQKVAFGSRFAKKSLCPIRRAPLRF